MRRYQQHLIDSNDAAHDLRATLNRPQDAQAMRCAIHELASRGMSDYGIAAATALSVEYVRRVLGEHSQAAS